MLHKYRHILAKLAALLLAPIFLLTGHFLNSMGLDELQALRQLERIPPADISAVMPGAVNLYGPAESLGQTINSPYTKTPTLYYRYLHEIEKRDSDGDTYWDTVEEYSDTVNFEITDSTGSITANTESYKSLIHWSVEESFQTIEGDHRYTEWRIDPGKYLFVLGYIKADQQKHSLTFPDDKNFRPIISTYDQDYEQQELGTYGILYLWGGIALLGFGIFCIAFLIKLHRVWIYLLIVMLTLSTYLAQISLSMLKQDMVDASQRLQEQETYAAQYLAQSSPDVARSIRINLTATWLQAEEQSQRIPEKLLAPLWGIKVNAPDINVSADEQAEAEKLVAELPSTKLRSGLLAMAAILAFILGSLFAWGGIRFIKHKRIIENIATQKTAGVVPGITEVKGTVVLDKEEALQGPLTSCDCVWYDYRVEELRSNGKNSSWVTIEHDTDEVTFACKDETGELRINPKSAEVLTDHRHVRRTRRMVANDLRYTELSLRVGDPLFAIGEAVVDRERCDHVRMQKKGKQWPFIISNRSEEEVMMNRGRWGLFWMNFGFSGLMYSTLLMFAQAGSFSPLDILMSALVAPLYMFLFMIALHYNDLVFLQQRVDRNYANIQTALKKRKDLMPNLEKLAKALMKHEADLMEKVTALRTQHMNAMKNNQAIAGFLGQEHHLFGQVKVVCEKYPQLKSNKSIKQLMTIIRNLEDEIELLRSGYLNAINLYNTRVDSFPDMFLARAAGFDKKQRIF